MNNNIMKSYQCVILAIDMSFAILYVMETIQCQNTRTIEDIKTFLKQMGLSYQHDKLDYCTYEYDCAQLVFPMAHPLPSIWIQFLLVYVFFLLFLGFCFLLFDCLVHLGPPWCFLDSFLCRFRFLLRVLNSLYVNFGSFLCKHLGPPRCVYGSSLCAFRFPQCVFDSLCVGFEFLNCEHLGPPQCVPSSSLFTFGFLYVFSIPSLWVLVFCIWVLFGMLLAPLCVHCHSPNVFLIPCVWVLGFFFVAIRFFFIFFLTTLCAHLCSPHVILVPPWLLQMSISCFFLSLCSCQLLLIIVCVRPSIVPLSPLESM